MDNFIEWLTDDNTSKWLMIPFVMLVVSVFFMFLLVSLILLLNELWFVSITIWLVIPAYVLQSEYSKFKKGKK